MTTLPPGQPLSGANVLIVEDRYFIAIELAEEVSRLGGRVLGPAANLERAERFLARERPDMALLDVNLNGVPVFPFARALAGQDVPFLFITGYNDTALPQEWRDRPRLSKPVDLRQLRAALDDLRTICGPSS